MITTIEKLAEKKEREYEGYIWGSDDKKPTLLWNNPFPFDQWKEKLPFIMEAMLYCKEEQTSVLIRHAGEYVVAEYDLRLLPINSVLEPIAYLPHRLDNVEKVHFQQLWIPEPDPNCERMEVLKMKALIFTGFNNQSKSEQDV